MYDLESLQLIQIGSTKFTEQFWKHEGWAIRQPAVLPQVDAMDLTDISTALADRVGIIEEYNSAINRGAAGARLQDREGNYDYGIDPVGTAPARGNLEFGLQGRQPHVD